MIDDSKNDGSISQEQYDIWEKQFREELYPSPSPETCTDDEDLMLSETNYFNDSDDDDLQLVSNTFCSQITSLKSTLDPKSSKYFLPVSTEREKFILKSNDETSPMIDVYEDSDSEISSDKLNEHLEDSEIEETPQKSRNGILHYTSFVSDDGELEIEVEGDDEEDYKVVSQWITDSQLDNKIMNNKRAQKEIKKRFVLFL